MRSSSNETIELPVAQQTLTDLGIAIPFAVHMLFPIVSSELFMGAATAFIVGPVIVEYVPSKSLWKRIVVTIIGILLVFVTLIGYSLP